MDILLLIVGFVLLIKGADFLIDGSSSIAKTFSIPNIVIGLTIVAFGTSLPEMVVNIFSSLSGNTDLAIGNVVGSNISNILLILGITAIICPIHIEHGTVWKEIPMNLLAVILLGVMVNDSLVDGYSVNELSRTDGIVLISFFIIFMYYIFGIGKIEDGDGGEIEQLPNWKSALYILLGIVGLTVGGKWIVDSASNIARSFELSDALIGLSIVAIGTSLPELATSVVAAYKKNVGLAVGNVVGSNIFNIFWVLGLSSIISPIQFNVKMNLDVLLVILVTVILFVLMHTKKSYRLVRWEGVIFVLVYFGYMGYLISRG